MWNIIASDLYRYVEELPGELQLLTGNVLQSFNLSRKKSRCEFFSNLEIQNERRQATTSASLLLLFHHESSLRRTQSLAFDGFSSRRKPFYAVLSRTSDAFLERTALLHSTMTYSTILSPNSSSTVVTDEVKVREQRKTCQNSVRTILLMLLSRAISRRPALHSQTGI